MLVHMHIYGFFLQKNQFFHQKNYNNIEVDKGVVIAILLSEILFSQTLQYSMDQSCYPVIDLRAL